MRCWIACIEQWMNSEHSFCCLIEVDQPTGSLMNTVLHTAQQPFKWHIKALFVHGNGEHKPQTAMAMTPFWMMTMTMTAMGWTRHAQQLLYGSTTAPAAGNPIPTQHRPLLPYPGLLEASTPPTGAVDDPNDLTPPFYLMGNALATPAGHHSPCLPWNSGRILPPAIDAAHKQGYSPRTTGRLSQLVGDMSTPQSTPYATVPTFYNVLMVQLSMSCHKKLIQYHHPQYTFFLSTFVRVVMGTNKIFKKYTQRTGRGPRKIKAQGNCQKDIWDWCLLEH
ncbi:hypothetical protein IW262DRAFT_1302341 [Armillaria fumosa]|nr:hypothetical protein IW262DRAFT_1302341 [Armillaria fumosa]